MKYSTTKFALIVIMGLLLTLAAYIVLNNRTDIVSQGPSVKATAPSTKIKIGYIPILDCSQIYVASELGYFSKKGLDVELTPFSSGSAIIQALSSGAIDVGFANLATVVFYEKSSPRLLRLAGGTRMDKNHSEAGLVVSDDAGIVRIADLKGKTIAVNSRRNIVDLALIKAVNTSGLSANDINLVELPFKDMEVAVRARRVDAATLPEPLLSSALKTPGLRNLGDHFVIAFGDVYSTGYFAMQNSSNAKPEVIVKFNAAISEATTELKNPTERTYEAVHAVTKLPTEILKSAGKPEFVVRVPETAFEQMAAWLEEEGFLDQKK